jgi:hypothetical protein
LKASKSGLAESWGGLTASKIGLKASSGLTANKKWLESEQESALGSKQESDLGSKQESLESKQKWLDREQEWLESEQK